MKNLFFCLFIFGILSSCSKHIISNIKTADLANKNFRDSVPFEKNNGHKILLVKIDGIQKRLIFDTGADLVIVENDGTKSIGKMALKDIEGNTTSENKIGLIRQLIISNTAFSTSCAIKADFPDIFKCKADGLIGNTIFKACNWMIEKNLLVFSDKAFEIKPSLVLKTSYQGSNRLFSSIALNHLDSASFLIDYGGEYDIQLPKSFYEKNRSFFAPNVSVTRIETGYGIIGLLKSDTVLNLNCNIDFNGVKIDSVNIAISNKIIEKQLGFEFLKRFNKIAINNSTNSLVFGELGKQTVKKFSAFDINLVDGYFTIWYKVVNDKVLPFDVGDKFTEINSKKSKDFSNYCEFSDWSRTLNKNQLTLKTAEGKVVTIEN